MRNYMHRLSKLILNAFIILNVFAFIFNPVIATDYVSDENVARGIGGELEDELKDLEEEIKKLESEQQSLQDKVNANDYAIAGYNSELSKLHAEVEILNSQIEQLDLEIKQLEIHIQILKEDIETKKKSIAETEENIEGLEFETGERIKNSYINFRLYGSSTSSSENLLNLDSINNYFKTSQYKSLIQKDTNVLLTELARLKQELKVKKQELDDQLVKVKKQKEEEDIKKADLSKKQEEAQVKVATYYSKINNLQSVNNQTNQMIAAFNEEEIKKRAEVEKLRQQIFDSFNSIGSGTYVVGGTMIGRQGSTGYSTGAHLHFSVTDNGYKQDPCGYLPAGVLPGCGWGSRLQWPIGGEMYYTSGYGNRCFWWNGQYTCDFHDGIDVAGVPWNTPIYAAHNGYLYKGVDYYGALYLIICENTNCNSGLKTGYWHLSAY